MDKITNSNLANMLNKAMKFHQPEVKERTRASGVEQRANDIVSFSNSGKIAQDVVVKSVQNASSFLQSNSAETTPNNNEQGFDVDAVVSTIFDFVSNGINAAKERGESDDYIKEMFSQAKQGINQGIDEALDELESLSLLNDELSGNIATSREQVITKVDDLYDDMFNPQKDNESLQVSQFGIGAYKSYSETSSIELVTNDGDKVSIYFGQAQEYGAGFSYSNGQEQNQASAGFAFSGAQSREFSISVQGELSDEERNAIGDLLEQVAEVQDSFFSNDIEQAFSKVQGLNIDFNQISSMSLELTQTQTIATQSYQKVADLGDSPLAMAKDEIKRLEDFMNNLKSLKEQVDEEFNISSGQFVSLMDAMFNEVFEPQASSADVFHQLAELISTDGGEAILDKATELSSPTDEAESDDSENKE